MGLKGCARGTRTGTGLWMSGDSTFTDRLVCLGRSDKPLAPERGICERQDLVCGVLAGVAGSDAGLDGEAMLNLASGFVTARERLRNRALRCVHAT